VSTTSTGQSAVEQLPAASHAVTAMTVVPSGKRVPPPEPGSDWQHPRYRSRSRPDTDRCNRTAGVWPGSDK